MVHPHIVKPFLVSMEKHFKELSKKLNNIQKMAHLLSQEYKEEYVYERDRLCIDLSSSMSDFVVLFSRFLKKYKGVGYD